MARHQKRTAEENRARWQPRRDAGETVEQIAASDGYSPNYVRRITHAPATQQDSGGVSGGVAADVAAAVSSATDLSYGKDDEFGEHNWEPLPDITRIAPHPGDAPLDKDSIDYDNHMKLVRRHERSTYRRRSELVDIVSRYEAEHGGDYETESLLDIDPRLDIEQVMEAVEDAQRAAAEVVDHYIEKNVGPAKEETSQAAVALRSFRAKMPIRLRRLEVNVPSGVNIRPSAQSNYESAYLERLAHYEAEFERAKAAEDRLLEMSADVEWAKTRSRDRLIYRLLQWEIDRANER